MSNAEPGRRGGVRLTDLSPHPADLMAEVIDGLRRPRKELPCKLLYDARGADLFEEICELDDYYPTRTELAIMRQHGADMAALVGPAALIVEYGSGSGVKTRLLLDALRSPAGYVPIDISREQLVEESRALAETYPSLEVLPVCADYTQPIEVPEPEQLAARRVAYFPGSTLGNFRPDEACAFLRSAAAMCGIGGGLLIGIDLRKDPVILHRAYNDAPGVTAAFNLNILERVNRDLGGSFNLDAFRHYAPYNPTEHRIEMHLASLIEQTAHVGEVEVSFERGETIWTESSYKYSLPAFERLARASGWRVERVWTDANDLFSVQYLTVQ